MLDLAGVLSVLGGNEVSFVNDWLLDVELVRRLLCGSEPQLLFWLLSVEGKAGGVTCVEERWLDGDLEPSSLRDGKFWSAVCLLSVEGKFGCTGRVGDVMD